MKKLHWMIAAAAGLLLISGAVQAQQVALTAHDLSASVPWGADGAVDGTDKGEVCVYCHTPHKSTTLAPLWNKTYTPGVFTLYTSATLGQVAAQPGPQSTACLSCHDGTIAVDNLANPPGLTAAFAGANTMLAGNLAYVGTSLSDDHPIGIDYSTSFGTDTGDFVLAPVASKLYADIIECATCHSVHDNANGSFLRLSNDDSDLCYDCHIK